MPVRCCTARRKPLTANRRRLHLYDALLCELLPAAMPDLSHLQLDWCVLGLCEG
jgi:hypothetical protein